MQAKVTFAAVMLFGANAAAATPPPVPVAPVVVAEDHVIGQALRALIGDMSLQGHFDAVAPKPAPHPPGCAEVGEVMRSTCYATAARMTRNPNLVFLFAETSSRSLRVECIGPSQNRAQRIYLDLAVATGEDPATARLQRQALAGCVIGALHSPPVPRPPTG